MNQKPPPRRARFQVHLSTAIVLMFVAGGLMWANMTNRLGYYGRAQLRIYEVYRWYGWPFVFLTKFGQANDSIFSVDDGKTCHIDYGLALFNGVFIAGVLTAVWYALEWRIRRQDARKSSERNP